MCTTSLSIPQAQPHSKDAHARQSRIAPPVAPPTHGHYASTAPPRSSPSYPLTEAFVAPRQKHRHVFGQWQRADIAAILQHASQQRCQLYTPYIEPNQRRLWFTPYPATQQRGQHVLNILQYEGKKRRIERLDIVFMPLIGIDQRGMRLGQGGGFYDTSLSFCREQQPLRIGIGFAAQQCEYIPNEAHDQAIDAYVCETGITAFSARARAILAPFLSTPS